MFTHKYHRNQEVVINDNGKDKKVKIIVCHERNGKPFYYVQEKPKDYHIGVFEEEIKLNK